MLVLTRQALPTIDRTKYAPASGLAKGAYVLADAPDGKPDVILIGTGSEVDMALEAYEKLAPKASRRVSSACRPGNCSSINPRNIAKAFCRRR